MVDETYINMDIAKSLYNEVFPFIWRDKINVFLIGANVKDKNSVRYRLRKEISNSKLAKREIYYPEEIFADLLYDSKIDLLTLENLLADSVHVVVICAESWGAIAELGAFANHEKLNKKLIVVADEKYKKAKSFIRQGPMRFLENLNRGKTKPILWFDFRLGDIGTLVRRINTAVSKVAINSHIKNCLTNPILAKEFFLVLIYVVGTITFIQLEYIVLKLGECKKTEDATTIVASALRVLLKHRDISLRQKKYTLTRRGYLRLESIFLRSDRIEMIKIIDSLRVGFLNKTLRHS